MNVFQGMKQLSVIIGLVVFSERDISAETAVIELIDGRFGRTEILDTTAVRDSSVAKITIATDGVISKISKDRISFIVLKNDTIIFRDVTSATRFIPDKKDGSFRFGRNGKLWVTGSFGFSAMNIRGLDAGRKMLLVTPAVRFFPTRDFFLGPRLQWAGVYSGVSSVNQVGAGADLGVLGNGTSVVFYFRTGFLLNVQQYKSELYKLEPTYAYGISWPFGIGMFIRLNRNLYLQIEPGYQIKVTENSTVNQFSLSFGIAGIGREYCVSTLHTLTNVDY